MLRGGGAVPNKPRPPAIYYKLTVQSVVDILMLITMDGDATTVAYTGARPGKAACSFPQGVVEMVLRSIVAVRSVQNC